MTSPRSVVGCAAALVALFGSVAAAQKAEKRPDALTIRLSASVATAESDVIVQTRVEPDDRSRALTIEWVSDDLSGGLHSFSLDGASAAATHRYVLKRLSAGHYVVTAALRLNDGSEIRRKSNLIVVGRNGIDESVGSFGADSPAGGRRTGRAR